MERPIIFNDAMSRAILNGAKTETRRPLKKQIDVMAVPMPNLPRLADCPFGVPGDTLWVRECWNADREEPEVNYRAGGRSMRLCPSLSDADWASFYRWRIKCFGAVHRNVPSIHMPRWASRTVLDVLDVRVERLQSMSEEDARAEGFESFKHIDIDQPFGGDDWRTNRTHPCTLAFASAWDGIYPSMSWASNPWVWRIEFRRAT